ncbi:hypothetical protein M433DRAFT_132010 [Acidomyces richmondensis BFW]|nr:MAG: hypothetical protein FE78DRAFT_66317 [Acidomyces sp. 'richmondensis']KYG48608.1 hypothetical protein M433DRAFT_132010 [Acidomyces richmondensis BFW]
MASGASAVPSPAGKKRSRDDDDADRDDEYMLKGSEQCSKKLRPTRAYSGDTDIWYHDSVINTPTASSQPRKYDSDDQSSMVSEPGSPQDLTSSSEDVDMEMDDIARYSQPAEESLSSMSPRFGSSSPWAGRQDGRHRVATPFPPSRPVMKSMQIKTVFKQHVRDRHPQENLSSDHLEVPSPIDEDEVPTPPSAADAAGSQLSMLSVNDMDIETPPGLPAINIEFDGMREARDPENVEASTNSTSHDVVVRKQRQRSGAQSNGSVSPIRLAGLVGGQIGTSSRKSLSIGYRSDCEKCRLRVPGHMNHFVT